MVITLTCACRGLGFDSGEYIFPERDADSIPVEIAILIGFELGFLVISEFLSVPLGPRERARGPREPSRQNNKLPRLPPVTRPGNATPSFASSSVSSWEHSVGSVFLFAGFFFRLS